jgi:hypothetical protein
MALLSPTLIKDNDKISSASSAMLLGTTISQTQAIQTKPIISTVLWGSDMISPHLQHSITGVKKTNLQQTVTLTMGTKVINTIDTMSSPSMLQPKAPVTQTTIKAMFSNDALPSTHSIAGVEKADLQQTVSLNMGTKVTTMSNPTESQQMVLKPQ